jgi:hypothetical protein
VPRKSQADKIFVKMKKKTIENVDPYNINYYVKRSQQKLTAGDVEGALADSKWALQKNPAAFDANLQKSDCVYEQNEIEYNIVDLSQKSKQYVGHRSRVFAQRDLTVSNKFILSVFPKQSAFSVRLGCLELGRRIGRKGRPLFSRSRRHDHENLPRREN